MKKARILKHIESKELQKDWQSYGRGMFYFGLIGILLFYFLVFLKMMNRI